MLLNLEFRGYDEVGARFTNIISCPTRTLRLLPRYSMLAKMGRYRMLVYEAQTNRTVVVDTVSGYDDFSNGIEISFV